MARGKLRAFVQRLKDRIAFNRRTFILYSVLRALVLLTLIRCIMTQRWEGVAISVLVLVLFLVPSILEDKARIERFPAYSRQSSTRLSLLPRSLARLTTTTY